MFSTHVLTMFAVNISLQFNHFSFILHVFVGFSVTSHERIRISTKKIYTLNFLAQDG